MTPRAKAAVIAGLTVSSLAVLVAALLSRWLAGLTEQDLMTGEINGSCPRCVGDGDDPNVDCICGSSSCESPWCEAETQE